MSKSGGRHHLQKHKSTPKFDMIFNELETKMDKMIESCLIVTHFHNHTPHDEYYYKKLEQTLEDNSQNDVESISSVDENDL